MSCNETQSVESDSSDTDTVKGRTLGIGARNGCATAARGPPIHHSTSTNVFFLSALIATIALFAGLLVAALALLATSVRNTFRMAQLKNVVVVGGSYVGLNTASELSKVLPEGYRVLVVEKNSHFGHLFAYPRSVSLSSTGLKESQLRCQSQVCDRSWRRAQSLHSVRKSTARAAQSDTGQGQHGQEGTDLAGSQG